MLVVIIKIFFLFPFVYFLGIIMKAIYATGGIFPTLLSLVVVWFFVMYVWLFAKDIPNLDSRHAMRKRKQHENKQANEWGIIDYFDKDE